MVLFIFLEDPHEVIHVFGHVLRWGMNPGDPSDALLPFRVGIVRVQPPDPTVLLFHLLLLHGIVLLRRLQRRHEKVDRRRRAKIDRRRRDLPAAAAAQLSWERLRPPRVSIFLVHGFQQANTEATYVSAAGVHIYMDGPGLVAVSPPAVRDGPPTPTPTVLPETDANRCRNR